MKIEVIPCDERYIDMAIELTYHAWEPIFEGYRQALGDKMFQDLYSDWREMKYKRVHTGLTSGRGFVTLVDGEFAGFIFYDVDARKRLGLVEENAVSDKFRGMGLAQKMYEHVFEKMREEGMVYTAVSTGLDDAHAPARKAYAKVGFDRGLPNVKYIKEL